MLIAARSNGTKYFSFLVTSDMFRYITRTAIISWLNDHSLNRWVLFKIMCLQLILLFRRQTLRATMNKKSSSTLILDHADLILSFWDLGIIHIPLPCFLTQKYCMSKNPWLRKFLLMR